MTALPLTADPTPYPDPHQDQARTARLRRALGKLITDARLLLQDVACRRSAMPIFWTAVRFGTKDMALIIARVTRGLQLAAALKATLPNPQEPSRRARPARAAPAARKPRTHPTPMPRNDANSVLATLPTSKEIAAQLRSRSIGDILTEICIALGIPTSGFLWQELERVLVENGADLDRIVEDADQRITVSMEKFLPPDIWQTPPTPSTPSFPVTAPAATGPP